MKRAIEIEFTDERTGLDLGKSAGKYAPMDAK